jgi:hypothetical protein
MINVTGFFPFSMHNTKCPNVSFALRPVSHDDSVPLPKLPQCYTLYLDSEPGENKKWALLSEITPGQKNAAYPALVNK